MSEHLAAEPVAQLGWESGRWLLALGTAPPVWGTGRPTQARGTAVRIRSTQDRVNCTSVPLPTTGPSTTPPTSTLTL